MALARRAEIPARAADNVGQGADIRGCKSGRPRLLPEVKKVGLFHIGQNHILLVGGAHFGKTVAVGQVGDFFQLGICQIAGAMPVGLSDRVTAA